MMPPSMMTAAALDLSQDVLPLAAARDAVRYCNSFNRLETIIGLACHMDAGEWLTLLGDEWSGCDDIAQHASLHDGALWETAFEELAWSPLDWRHHMMTAEERMALDALPQIVTVWRGCYASNKRGLCWSLDRAVAERFPFLHRYRQEGQALLVRGEVDRDHIMALKLDRDESEIVVLPSRVKIRATSHAQC